MGTILAMLIVFSVLVFVGLILLVVFAFTAGTVAVSLLLAGVSAITAGTAAVFGSIFGSYDPLLVVPALIVALAAVIFLVDRRRGRLT
ncbi:MAG: hypothetical protein JXQ83_05370 [Candidatus Glassbacteria bacterium]|nr:hypothetical protein [Candidatus Glassbacteria bacterium]